MSRRWTPTEIVGYTERRHRLDAVARSESGFVTVKPDLRRRGQHKNAYAYHAAAYCRALGLPEPIGEHYPLEDREFRLDVAWPERKLAIEVQGGIWTGGAHARGAGIERDMEKHNLCVIAGWRLFYCAPAKLADVIQSIKAMFGPNTVRRKPNTPTGENAIVLID